MENHIEVEVEETSSKRDKGFTLVELLIVIVILGILATVTVFAVRGITDKGTTSACNSDKVTLQTAVESYIAQFGGTTIPSSSVKAAGAIFAGTPGSPALVAGTMPSGATGAFATAGLGAYPADTLKNAGFLRAAPSNLFVGPDGVIYSQTATCAAIGSIVG